MSEISEMIGKVNIGNLVSYFMYGQDSSVVKIEDYEKSIEDSYEKIFTRLEKISPNLSRHDDELFGTVMDFTIIHNEIYLQMGMLVGFQIYKALEKEYQGLDSESINAFIKKCTDTCIVKEKTE